jgi:hypothetical protein
MITENQAIRELYAGPVSFTHNGVFYHGDFERPTEEQIQAKIAELTAEEPLRLLRQQRNQLLQQSDWMAVSDRLMTQEQVDYRQALRDLPETADPQLDENGQLTNVTWPTYE